jgi:signal transduction histidine kinase
VTVVKHLSDDLPLIPGNKCELEEIFLNLILNSFQAMKEGGTLTIQAGTGDRQEVLSATRLGGPAAFFGGPVPCSVLIISLQDTGPGMTPEQMNSLFKPFSSGSSPSSGFGLGLYITKQLVERNGGRISVRSQEGKGTEFRLEFKQSFPNDTL